MFEIPGNYLKTYNPRIVEEHTDSSEFEDDIEVSLKQSCHSLVQPDIRLKLPRRNLIYHADIGCPQHVVKSDSICQSKNTQVNEIPVRDINNHNTRKNIKNNGDDIEQTRSKSSILKTKIIPSLSCIFRRSTNNPRTLTSIKENPTETVLKDNGCQVQCSNCEREQMRKLNGQSYTIQPVYALERNLHQYIPYTAKYTQASLNRLHNSSKMYSNTSFIVNFSSDDSDFEKEKERRLFKKRLRKELRKEYERLRLQRHPKKHVAVQSPSVFKKDPSLVYNSQYTAKSTRIDSDYDSPYFNDMPSTSSGFWDYLFDRFKRKYQTNRVENPKPCFCRKNNNKYDEMHHSDSQPGDECCGILKNSNDDTNITNRIPPPPPPSLASKKIPDDYKRVECRCTSDKLQKQASSREPPQACNGGRSCQQPHEELTQALAKQYNGEILCIHNPPCILVNGCLNIPLEKEQNSTNVWTATQSKKGSFFKNAKKYINSKKTQDCQYYAPTVEIRQCQTSEHKSEKKIQSLCHHKPPCEVVRCCHKKRYDPSLANSCVHVPMCQKVPECVLYRLNKNLPLVPCKHVPKCPEKPVCSTCRSEKYTVFTANQTIGTQVKPQPTMICRHEPPCIMIPRCLGRTMCDNYIPHEAIPKCVHQPLCDMIPACCRKTKEMVSAGSQYPNGCRVV